MEELLWCVCSFFSCAGHVSLSLLQGTLKGFDQTINLILHDAHERVYSPDAGVELVPLGLYVIRGDNV